MRVEEGRNKGMLSFQEASLVIGQQLKLPLIVGF